jgi:hypothetical protein
MTERRNYHSSTFQLLGVEPEKTRATVSLVEDVEIHLGLKLPESVRDWYGRDGAMQILAKHSNDDPPVPIQDLSIIEQHPNRLLPIRHENQGVCTWAVALDGSQDPPVLVDVDSGGKNWQTPGFDFF